MALFDAIEIFARVVEAGNITRAAEQLGLSKSRVSECVIALEKRLGVRLLDRTTRHVSPTEAGVIFYQRCTRALEEAHAGVTEVMAYQETPVGHMRIGAPEAFADRFIIPALGSFLAENPQVTAEIVEDMRMVNLVEQRLDLSIRIVREPEPATIVRKLGMSEILVCAAPDYIARHGVPQHPVDIPDHKCIGFAALYWAREWSFLSPQKHTVSLSPVMICNSTASLRAAVVSGIGLAALPRWAVATELNEGALVRVMRDWTLPESGIYAVYPSNRLVTAKVRRFVDHLAPILRQSLSDMPDMDVAQDGCPADGVNVISDGSRPDEQAASLR